MSRLLTLLFVSSLSLVTWSQSTVPSVTAPKEPPVTSVQPQAGDKECPDTETDPKMLKVCADLAQTVMDHWASTLKEVDNFQQYQAAQQKMLQFRQAYIKAQAGVQLNTRAATAAAQAEKQKKFETDTAAMKAKQEEKAPKIPDWATKKTAPNEKAPN